MTPSRTVPIAPTGPLVRSMAGKRDMTPVDVVIVGGGIAGNALATVLARAGKMALVLERSSVYRDRVRGEFIQPWGVAEARRLGLEETLVRAGGTYHTRFVPYDETEEP